MDIARSRALWSPAMERLAWFSLCLTFVGTAYMVGGYPPRPWLAALCLLGAVFCAWKALAPSFRLSSVLSKNPEAAKQMEHDKTSDWPALLAGAALVFAIYSGLALFQYASNVRPGAEANARLEELQKQQTQLENHLRNLRDRVKAVEMKQETLWALLGAYRKAPIPLASPEARPTESIHGR